MIVNKQFSQDIEGCIKQTHINVYQHYHELGHVSNVLNVGSGVACFLGNESFLSQVIAWGFNADINIICEQLQLIEDFYMKNNFFNVNIELSPLCGSNIAELLSKKGYKITEFNNISYMKLDNYYTNDEAKNIFIVEKKNLAIWAERIAIGFGHPAAASQFNMYANSKDVIPFCYLIDDEIAAGGTIAIHGKICDLGVTSTMPQYRGKGLQKSLLQARLAYAKTQGVKTALVTTEPGSISDINVQKTGFKTAYTRIKFSKQLPKKI